jgi:hypothetical protein
MPVFAGGAVVGLSQMEAFAGRNFCRACSFFRRSAVADGQQGKERKLNVSVAQLPEQPSGTVGLAK